MELIYLSDEVLLNIYEFLDDIDKIHMQAVSLQFYNFSRVYYIDFCNRYKNYCLNSIFIDNITDVDALSVLNKLETLKIPQIDIFEWGLLVESITNVKSFEALYVYLGLSHVLLGYDIIDYNDMKNLIIEILTEKSIISSQKDQKLIYKYIISITNN